MMFGLDRLLILTLKRLVLGEKSWRSQRSIRKILLLVQGVDLSLQKTFKLISQHSVTQTVVKCFGDLICTWVTHNEHPLLHRAGTRARRQAQLSSQISIALIKQSQENILAKIVRCTRWSRHSLLGMCISWQFYSVLLSNSCWARKDTN